MDSQSDGDMLPNASFDPVAAPTDLFTVPENPDEEAQAQATRQLQAELDAYLRQPTKAKRKRTKRGHRTGKSQRTPEPVQGDHDTVTSYAIHSENLIWLRLQSSPAILPKVSNLVRPSRSTT